MLIATPRIRNAAGGKNCLTSQIYRSNGNEVTSINIAVSVIKVTLYSKRSPTPLASNENEGDIKGHFTIMGFQKNCVQTSKNKVYRQFSLSIMKTVSSSEKFAIRR
jgi:hypothetical protein